MVKWNPLCIFIEINYGGKVKGFNRLANTDFVLQDFEVGCNMNLYQDKNELIDFASSEYLGLSTDIRKEDLVNVKKVGLRNGWSRISGNTSVTYGLERDLSAFLGFEATRLAQSISLINVTIFSALSKVYHFYLFDKDVHITLKMGLRTIKKDQVVSFENNNLVELESILKQRPMAEKKIIVIDGVYSMRGEVASIEKLQLLLEKYNCDLLIDDAHGFGVIGYNGRGVASRITTALKKRTIYIASFSKCASNPVGFVSSSKELCEKLDLSAPFLIYSGPPSNLHVLISNRHLNSFETEEFKLKRELLFESSKDIHRFLFENDIKYLSTSGFPIISMCIHPEYLEAIITSLKSSGIFAKPAIFPVVQKGDEVIRFTLTVNNCQNGIPKLKAAILRVKEYTRRWKSAIEISV